MSEQKIALITGATRGLGREIARQLGQYEGIIILAGVRNLEVSAKLTEALANEGVVAVRPVLLDVTDNASVLRVATLIEREYGKLDILVNNAGVLLDQSAIPSETTLETLKATYEINVFGAFAVTRALLPLLRKSEAGRIVNMSSGLGSLSLNTKPDYEYYQTKLVAYNSSKAALNALTIHFAYEVKETNVKVNSADPGYVATGLNNFSGPRSVEEGAAIAVKLATLAPDGPSGGFFNDKGKVEW